MQVLHREDHLKTRDGILLYLRHWTGNTRSKGLVGLVHDYGEHCSRYGHLAALLVEAGFDLISFDQRGHGKSEGMRGYINRYQSLREDLEDFQERMKHSADQRPVFFLGLGTGATLLIHHQSHGPGPAQGTILVNPTLQLPFRFTSLGLLYCQLASWLFPGWFLPGFMFNKPPNLLAADAETVAQFECDPFNYQSQMRNRTAIELYRSINQASRQAAQLHQPTLVLHGEADGLTTAEGCQTFFEQIGCDRKTLHCYPSASHALFTSTAGEQAASDLVTWLNARVNDKE